MSVLAGFIISLPYHLHAISAFPLSFQATVLGTGTALYGIVTLYIVLSTGPYVAYLRWLPHDGRKKPQGIEMTTHTLFMRERITRVYNPAFLVDADKPFTVWKLARNFRLPPFVANIVKVGDEEVVAETFDKSGKVIGRWIVTWGEGGIGVCRSEGKIQRYFSVHQELLPRAIQWGPH
ncbi:hypothetical protein QCA50_005188 [Cerrena zonata]|uniref:Uncharacterized protein n=1 Tax=Cerrena zonata TaxID=2478898 RepID=A0AAW0GER9_9APHY